MPDRSARLEVRNPILGLPAIAAFRALPPEAKTAVLDLLDDIRRDAIERADMAWRQNKAPMAAYWKAVSVYALHTRRAISRP